MGSPKIHRCHSFDQRHVFFNVLLHGYISKIHTIYFSTTNSNYFKLLRTYKFSSCKSIFDFACANDRLGICSSDFFKVFFWDKSFSNTYTATVMKLSSKPLVDRILNSAMILAPGFRVVFVNCFLRIFKNSFHWIYYPLCNIEA